MNGRKSFGKKQLMMFFQYNEIFSKQKRKDKYGYIIVKSAYVDHNSKYVWDIYHKDGNSNNNNKQNLQALSFNTHKNLHN